MIRLAMAFVLICGVVRAGTCTAPKVPRAVIVSELYLVCPQEGYCWRQTRADLRTGYKVVVECLTPEQSAEAEARGR